MGYTPLDGSLITSTILKEGPDVVAVWMLLLASTDKLGESTMQPAAAASLLRISDDRAKRAFVVLASPDPDSRNREHDGRRILPRDGGKWHVTSAAKYQWLASRAAATERQRKYEANKKLRDAAPETCGELGCPHPPVAAIDGRHVCSGHSFMAGGE